MSDVTPRLAKIRRKVEPRDGPISQAARKLNLRFPRTDPTTEMFFLKAIDAWQDNRNPQVFAEAGNGPAHARGCRRD
jgi:hypothetical protein